MRPFLLIPLAALVAVLPFLTGGHSCGFDFGFHMQSWLGAAEQFRQGVFYPRWNFLAAFNAGEPRFVFYPPLSWLLGAALSFLLPFNFVPTAETWAILTVAGFTMYRLARDYAPQPVALLSACVFLANPFMLFTVTGRNAYGELLAAAVCPLLLRAMLASRPSPWRIGLALALLWLSNVPGGVLGTYCLLLLALVRLAQAARRPRTHLPTARRTHASLLYPAATFTGGLVYGLALPAFFLLPALYERRFIRMGDAFAAELQPTRNLFFERVLLPTQDSFLLRTEHIALGLFAATFLALLFARFAAPSAAQLGTRSARGYAGAERSSWQRAGVPVTLLALVLAFLMTSLAAPLWRHLPALWVAQFPWRGLFLLGACLAFAVALALRNLHPRPLPAALASFAITAALAFSVVHATRVPCVAGQLPVAFLADLRAHRPPEPVSEYVVATGDANFLRPDNPPFWLASSPAGYAPGTTPNPAAIDADATWPAAAEGAQLDTTPLHFTVRTASPAYLVVNLQNYPNWRIQRNGGPALPHLSRPDGLLAIALPAGTSSLAIMWHHSWDEYLGGLVSVLAIVAFLLCRRRSLALFLPASVSSASR